MILKLQSNTWNFEHFLEDISKKLLVRILQIIDWRLHCIASLSNSKIKLLQNLFGEVRNKGFQMVALVLMTEPTFSYPARINSAIDTDYHTLISLPQSSEFLPAPLTKMPEDSGNEIATNNSRIGYLRVF